MMANRMANWKAVLQLQAPTPPVKKFQHHDTTDAATKVIIKITVNSIKNAFVFIFFSLRFLKYITNIKSEKFNNLAFLHV